MAKKRTTLRICTNYAKPCPLANRCDNCKHRAMRRVLDKDTQQYGTAIACKKGYDPAGDKSKCFECASEGYRCKT